MKNKKVQRVNDACDKKASMCTVLSVQTVSYSLNNVLRFCIKTEKVQILKHFKVRH